MPLTSVQVRGKRKQQPTSSEPSEPSARPTKAKRSLHQVHAARAFNPRARLEALPTEILEDVLLYSVNVALPRCSHVVGAKLSDRATLIRFCMVVFDDTWGKHLGKQPGRTKTRDDPRHAKVEVSNIPLPSLNHPPANHPQTALLTQPWAKVDILLQAQQAWAQRYQPTLRYQYLQPWGTSLTEPTTYEPSTSFDEDYKYMVHMWRTDVSSVNTIRSVKEINSFTRAPQRLFHGPWSEEMLRRIFFFWRAGADLDATVDAIPWEYRIVAFNEAIKDPANPPWAFIKCVMARPGYAVHFPLPAQRALVKKISDRLAERQKQLNEGDADNDFECKVLAYYQDLASRRPALGHPKSTETARKTADTTEDETLHPVL